MSTPQLHFLGWDKPAIELVATKLLAGLTTPATAAQYRRATVVVPTAESGRRLREYMAELAGKAILMPRIKQASHLVSYEKGCSELLEYAAWIQVLNIPAPHEEWPTLFPQAPLTKLNWSHGMGRQLMQLRRKLDEACLTPTRIAADFAHRSQERDSARWEEIADIFTRTDALLQKWGCTPDIELRRQASLAELDYLENNLLIVACLPQMTERFRRFLDAAVQRECKVELYIHATEAQQHLFHPIYGTPLPAWKDEPICIPDEVLHVVADSPSLVYAALKACEYEQSNKVVLGCCDASFSPALRNGFNHAGWPLNMPEGRSFLTSDAGQLPAQLLRAHSNAQQLYAIEPLLRNAALQRAWGLLPHEQSDVCLWLDEILQKKMISATSSLIKQAYATKEHSPHRYVYLHRVELLLKQLEQLKTIYPALLELARDLRAAYAHSTESPQVESFGSILQELAETLPKVEAFSTPAAVLTLLQSLTGQQATQELSFVSTPRDKTALDASGWMELSYCRGNKLVLCGMHEQCVPERPSVDAFLPESLCRHYAELPGIEQRVARDSFLLTALLQTYGNNATLLVAQMADDGTPIVPSQLLLRYPSKDSQALLARVHQLFTAKPPSTAEALPGTWKMRTPVEKVVAMEHISMLRPGLQSPWADAEAHFSPSTLARFLTCPLRFWLKELLKLDPQNTYEEGKTAMNAAEYGTMLHSILEQLVSQFPDSTHNATRDDIAATATRLLQEELATKYGESLSLPLMAQKQMLENSLLAFAEQHEKDLQNAWENVYLEHHVETTGWKLDGDIVFRMTLDRVDRKVDPDNGRTIWRIIDYKTSDKKPLQKHLEKVKDDTVELFCRLMPDFPLLQKESRNTESETASYRWKEVQLPLYARWLMDEHHVPLEDIEIGYYLMPRNKKECKFEAWKLTQEEMDSAMQWVKSAVNLIREGRCLLSAESLGQSAYSEFGALAPDGDPRSMMGLPDITTTKNSF